MSTSAFNKFNSFTSELGKGTHNLSSNALKVALTNTAPSAANAILSDITQIAASGGYTAGGFALTGVSWTTAAGVAKLVIADYVVTATGSMGPFQYAVVYNDTPASPLKPLIGWVDYGAPITLGLNETFTLDFDGTNGVFTVT
jgi:hypothetical protein